MKSTSKMFKALFGGGVILLLAFALAGHVAAQTGPTFNSATFFGGTGDQRGTRISIANGALYLSGISGTDWGAEGLVVKYAIPSVSLLWSATWPNSNGPDGPDGFNGIAVSNEGVYLAGYSYSQTTDGCGGKEAKSVLVKFPLGGGASMWTAPVNFFPYRGTEMFEDVATDGSTYIYAVGGGESYGWGPFAMVLAKYDTSGNRINMVTEPGLTLGFDPCFLYQNVGQSWSQGVIVHNNNIYVVGVSALTGVGEDSVPRPFLSKFDSNLNRQWKRRPTDLGPGGFRGVTGVGSAIYAVGYTYTSGVANSEDYLIQKYDEDGNLLWSRASGGLNTDILTGVVGIGSRLFAVGYTRSQGAGGADAVILEIDPANGDTLSTTLFGDAQDDMANGVATDGTDLYVVGESRSFTVGGNAVGQNDLMLLRFTLAAPNTPPVAVCQNVTVEADSICTANASIDNGSYDPDGDPITLTQSPAGPYPLGGTLVTLTVSDDKGESSQCTGTVTVVDNTAPTITCPADIVNSTDLGQCSAIQDYTVTAKDNCAGWMVMTSPPSGSNFPKGTTLVTATAIDLARNTATCTFMVAVEDREPPKITGVSANPAVLWPPNHKMVSVAVAAYVSDNCDTAPACKIISVNSNEPENGLGDGDTAPDWQIIPGSLTVNLRAERSGTGSGRVYTITVQCTDASGNTSTRAVQVSVPHDQGKK